MREREETRRAKGHDERRAGFDDDVAAAHVSCCVLEKVCELEKVYGRESYCEGESMIEKASCKREREREELH